MRPYWCVGDIVRHEGNFYLAVRTSNLTTMIVEMETWEESEPTSVLNDELVLEGICNFPEVLWLTKILATTDIFPGTQVSCDTVTPESLLRTAEGTGSLIELINIDSIVKSHEDFPVSACRYNSVNLRVDHVDLFAGTYMADHEGRGFYAVAKRLNTISDRMLQFQVSGHNVGIIDLKLARRYVLQGVIRYAG